MASQSSDMKRFARDSVAIPELVDGRDLDIELLRDPRERLYGRLLWAMVWLMFAGIVGMFGYLAVSEPVIALTVLVYVLGFLALTWLNWKLVWAWIEGNSVRVSPNQYPPIYDAVRDAAMQLGVEIPKIYVMQGSGLIDTLVAKQFTRRGYIILTSNLMEALIESGTSRELLMLVGRQLGHLKAGHFRYWLLRDTLGLATYLLWIAYWRRCHATADRIGLMVAGNLYAAEQALLLLMVGPKLAAHTNMEELDSQTDELRDHFWPRVTRILSEYGLLVDRITRLRAFAARAQDLKGGSDRPRVGVLPIRHMRLRALPIMLVHGHDRTPVLEVKDFLRSHYPHVAVIVMALEQLGASALPEKFERLAAEARGAIAILSPDDIAYAVRDSGRTPLARARQNVVLEIGWFWGRLGRASCLLLSRGQIEVPSDLHGVERCEYMHSVREQFESIRTFVGRLEEDAGYRAPSASSRMPTQAGVSTVWPATPPGAPARPQMARGTWTIGREANIVIDSDGVSRVHAHLEVDGGVFYIVDRQSRNGTYVNGKRIAADVRVAVSPSDVVRLGMRASASVEELLHHVAAGVGQRSRQ